MARLTLALLGGFSGRFDAPAPLMLPTRKTQALLAFLALPPGQSHPRDRLATLLWGGTQEAQARKSLRQSLFTLRKALGPDPSLLRIEGGTVALSPDAVAVDVLEFERGISDGTPVALERAVTLYRGDLLEGLPPQETAFEEWLLAERERLRELAIHGLARLLQHHRAVGTASAALQTALRLLALDPMQEPVHRAVMRLYAQLGRRASALRQYQVCVGVLQRELGVEPEPATKELYREILRRPAAAATPDVESRAGAPDPGPEAPSSREAPLPRELPLIGREPEMDTLRTLLDRVGEGHGRVATVIGEAGVGKSRLVAEVAAEAVARGARILVGRCYEAEQILPFTLWSDALQTVGLTDAEREALGALDPAGRSELARLLPRLGGAGDAPRLTPIDYRHLFESVARLLRHLVLRQPVVLVLEDLHWSDEMSLRLLSFVARRLRGWPLLLLTTVREEELARAPVLRRTLEDLAGNAPAVDLRLAPLSRSDTLRIVAALARADRPEAVTPGLAEHVWLVSEGNPFAAIETVRALPSSGATEVPTRLAVPARVRAVIVRHLESLSDRGRSLATVASVIGREFEFPLLCRAAGLEEPDAAESLEELVRHRVVHSVGERFDFTHDRIREVAYDGLLAERRRALHARIAGVMEMLYADRLEEQVERLAHHAARGRLDDKAVVYLRQAGAKAFASSAHADALAYFTQALQRLPQLVAGTARDREELALRLAFGPVLQMTRGYAAPDVEQNYARARQLADEIGGPVDRFRARWGLWLVASHRASANEALQLGREVLAIAEELDDPALLLEGHHALWPLFVWLGRPEAARRHLDQGIALYDKTRHRSHAFLYGGHDPGVCCWKVASWASWILGYPARGLKESLASLSLARELDHPPSLVVALVWACVFHDLRREVPDVREHARTLIRLSREHEAAQWLAFGTILAASAEAAEGDGAAGVGQIRSGLAAYRSTGAHLFVPYFLSLLARACLKAGRADEGLDALREALETARATGERVWEPELLRLEGELRLAVSADDSEEVVDCFRRAIAVAREQAARSWELRARVSLARVLSAHGQHEEARAGVRDVYQRFTEGFDTADLQDARALIESR